MSETVNERYDNPRTLRERGVEIFDPQIPGWWFGFLIEVTARYVDVAVSLDVRLITSRAADGSDIGSEPYLTAYMKWDSCMQVRFAKMGEDGDGDMHLCGIESWLAHAAVMKRIYHKAFEVMGREPEDGQAWPT